MDLALIEIKSLYPGYLQYFTNPQFHFRTWYQYGFFYKMSKYGMNMYEIREVMAVFGFVQNYANCTELCDKLDVRRTQKILLIFFIHYFI